MSGVAVFPVEDEKTASCSPQQSLSQPLLEMCRVLSLPSSGHCQCLRNNQAAVDFEIYLFG